MENPPGNHQQGAHHPPSSFNGPHLNNGSPAPEALGSGLKHNPGISMEWTLEEQTILEDGLKKFASDLSVACYAKIAMQLPNKTVRDVALRCRWTTKKESSKRRREEHNLARKNKDKKERVAGSSAKPTHFAGQSSISPYPTLMIPMDYNDGIPCRAIGGVTGELLGQNVQALNQVSANLASFRIQENIGLLAQTRDNLLKIMNAMNDSPDIMKQMPQLPVKLPPPPPPMP